MRFRLRVLLIGLALVVVAVGAAVYSRGTWGLLPPRFAQTARHSRSTVVYEGLPHQLYEHDLLEREKQTKATREIHGFPFYRDPLAVNPEDAERLASMLASEAMWRPFTGEKKCGGFHPDFAVELQADGNRFIALLCFGCGEGIIVRGTKGWRYDASLGPRELLESYRKNRPVRTAFP